MRPSELKSASIKQPLLSIIKERRQDQVFNLSSVFISNLFYLTIQAHLCIRILDPI